MSNYLMSPFIILDLELQNCGIEKNGLSVNICKLHEIELLTEMPYGVELNANYCINKVRGFTINKEPGLDCLLCMDSYK